MSPRPRQQPISGNMVAEMVPEFAFGGAGSRTWGLADLNDAEVPAGVLGAAPIGRTDVGFGWFGAAAEPETVRAAVRPVQLTATCGAPLSADPMAEDDVLGRAALTDALVTPRAIPANSVWAAAAAVDGGAVGGAVGGASVAATEAMNAPASHPLSDLLEIAQSIGRKIPHCYENPVDNVLIDINEKVNPLYHRLGLVPNHVTLLSAVFGIGAVVALARGAFVWAGVLYMVSYYFDVADGNYARAYKLVSKFGDLLDHGKDILVVAALYWVIVFRLSLPIGFKVAFFVVQALLVAGMTIHLGCQENYYEDLKKKKEGAEATSESAALSGLRGMCYYDPETKMPITRWIGCGTHAVVTAAWLIAMRWWVR